MINQMDQVYANASLTIINASGSDAQNGLPGVTSFARQPQKCVHIRKTAILELPCGEHELNSSKWLTRGWTYQEGYFSTRRLVFTPSQVLFLCNETYQEESVHRLLGKDLPEYEFGMGRFEHLIPDFSRGELMHLSLLDQLSEYSGRELTYDSDSLKAFLGIFNSYKQNPKRLASTPLHLAWGLFFHLKQTEGLRVYLDWQHNKPAARRPEFPSWTWAGWGGPLTIWDKGITLPKVTNDSRHFPHLDWEIHLELDGNKTVNIWDLAGDLLSAEYTDNLQRHQQPAYLKQLQITCLTSCACALSKASAEGNSWE